MESFNYDPEKAKFRTSVLKASEVLYSKLKYSKRHKENDDKEDEVEEKSVIDEIALFSSKNEPEHLCKVIECLAVDNNQLKEKNLLFRYETELLKDKLEESECALKNSFGKETTLRKDNAYLKHKIEIQSEEIENLKKTVEKLVQQLQIDRPDLLLANGNGSPSSVRDDSSPIAERVIQITYTSTQKQADGDQKSEENGGKTNGPKESEWIQSFYNLFKKKPAGHSLGQSPANSDID